MKANVELQEPDCKKKIKRIIAREGLILLIVIILLFVGIVYPMGAMKNWLPFLALVYPVYLIIRFIIWAIKTLKEK